MLYFADRERDTLAFIAEISSLENCNPNFTKIDIRLLSPVYNFADRNKQL